MCTAVIEVPESPDGAVRLLAVRDEDPGRAWDAPGHWWEDLPEVIGVRDRLAGGAWLAAVAERRRLAMILNRAGAAPDGRPGGPKALGSRGRIVLEDVAGRPIPDPPGTANFNLVSVEGARATVTSWDGSSLRRAALSPGVHMIAHHGVDDAARTARIAHWLPAFRSLAGLPDEAWRERWVSLLDESAALAPDDDRAIIRDNRGHGYPTLSLLVVLAELPPGRDGSGALRLDAAVLDEPARWSASGLSAFSG